MNHNSRPPAVSAAGSGPSPNHLPPGRWRRLLAELVGTALLATAVVGSGIMATDLSPDAGVQLLANSLTTALALAVLILILGPVSGAHLNPVVSAADWFLHRRTRAGLTGPMLIGYVLAQTLGAISGTVLANLMFALPAVELSRTDRAGVQLWLGEVVATAGLILLIVALARTGRTALTPAAVGAWIGAACWFTSSTSFANPALTIGRSLTDTLAGITPADVPGFAAAQLVGLAVGTGLLVALYPATDNLATTRPSTEPAVDSLHDGPGPTAVTPQQTATRQR